MPKKYAYRDEIRKILIQYGVSFTVICALLIYGFLGYYTRRIVEEKNHNYNAYTQNVLSHELRLYEDAIHEIEKSEALISYLETGEGQTDVYEILYAFNNQIKLKNVFYVVNHHGETILSSNYVESPYNGYGLFLSGLFKQLKNNPDAIVYMNNKVQIDLTKRTVYSIGKAVTINGAIRGYLIFDILESDLKKAIYSKEAETLIVTDQYNNSIVSSNDMLLDDIGKFNIKPKANGSMNQLDFMGNSYYYSKSEISDGGLQIYTLSSLTWINRLLTVTMSFALIMMLGLSGMVVYTAALTSKKKTLSISQVIDSIDKVKEGDLKAFVKIETGDEFQLIGEQFNDMLEKLGDLINKNHELLDRNRIAEIKQLESQFNPHFIFNTLETLKYMISVDQKKASEMIVKFANLLRYSIDYDKKTIALEQDLLHLTHYLTLQKFRYNQRLTYGITVDDSVKACIVPKLILQPIIENCINHGYRSKDHLQIDLTIEASNEELIMSVRDNGDGIPESKMVQLQEALDNRYSESNCIGLTNVHRRLQLLYGDTYGLSLESIVGEGTTVVMKLPKQVG